MFVFRGEDIVIDNNKKVATVGGTRVRFLPVATALVDAAKLAGDRNCCRAMEGPTPGSSPCGQRPTHTLTAFCSRITFDDLHYNFANTMP